MTRFRDLFRYGGHRRFLRISSKRSQTSRRACIASVVFCFLFIIVTLSVPSVHQLRPSRSILSSYNHGNQYQLATLLNIPSYIGIGHHDGSSIHTTASKVATKFPNSILSRYRAFPSVCATQPFRPYLRQAVASYITDNELTNFSTIEANDTLLIHIDFTYYNHDSTLPQELVYAVNELSVNFNKILVLVSNDNSNDLSSLQESIEEAIPENDQAVSVVEILIPENDDDAAVKMTRASHLLIHAGAVSALGALVNIHNVYYTSLIDDYMQNDQIRWLVNNATRIPHLPGRAGVHYPQLNLMGPVIPNCCSFDSFGTGDDKKVVCTNAASFKTNNCWIMSVGCRGKWEFETAVVERTSCKVHTFDCTGDWDIPEDLKGKVFLHKLCLGDKRETRQIKKRKVGEFRPINDLIEIGSRKSGFKDIILPSFAKLDIEGYEFMAIRAMLEQEDKSMIPEQLVMEIHVEVRIPLNMFTYHRTTKKGHKKYFVIEEKMAEFFAYVSGHGYELVHRSDNPFCKKCSEITMVKRYALPPSA